MKREAAQWARANPEKMNACQKAKREKQKQKDPLLATRINRRWRDKNPERASALARAESARQRAKQNGAGGKYTPDEWLALLAKYNGKCLCCGTTEDIQADHVIPISKGGSSFITNIQPLCRACNMAKGKKSTDYRPS